MTTPKPASAPPADATVGLPKWGPGYRVDVKRGIVYGLRGKPIRCLTKAGGYIRVNNHGACVGMAHRIIWEVAKGKIPADKRVDHWNGNPADNRIANLRLVSCGDIVQENYDSGALSARGAGNGRAKLSDDDVLSIRTRYRSGQMTQAALAVEYGVSPKTINHACTGYRWPKPAKRGVAG
jgi:hypothetical protein